MRRSIFHLGLLCNVDLLYMHWVYVVNRLMKIRIFDLVPAIWKNIRQGSGSEFAEVDCVAVRDFVGVLIDTTHE